MSVGFHVNSHFLFIPFLFCVHSSNVTTKRNSFILLQSIALVGFWALDAAEHPTKYGTAPRYEKNQVDQNVSSAQVEKLYFCAIVVPIKHTQTDTVDSRLTGTHRDF